MTTFIESLGGPTILIFIGGLISALGAVWAAYEGTKGSKKLDEKNEEIATLNRRIAEVVSAHLEVARQQREDEIKRLAQRPKFEFAIGTIPEAQLHGASLPVQANEQQVVEFDIIVKNMGEVTARQPMLLVTAEPTTIALSERGQPKRPRDAYTLSLGGLSVADMPPYSVSETPYRYAIDAILPLDVPRFKVGLKMWGDNAPVRTLLVEFEVKR